jgi:hypothetical protein
MQYYTYKITFKDLPGYFYYGKHKDDGKPYFGSPKTWRRVWRHFEPEIQVLQRYETAGEVEAAEESVIRATWDNKYSLNEAVGARVSEEVCRENGKNHPPKVRSANCKKMNDHVNTVASRSNNGKKTGPDTVKAMNSHVNAATNRSANGKKNGAYNGKASSSKRILLTNVSTGESFEFPSGREACRVLGLDLRNLNKVIGGKYKQHKGYTAVYL